MCQGCNPGPHTHLVSILSLSNTYDPLRIKINWGYEDSSVSKILASQARVPKVNQQDPREMLSVVAHTVVPVVQRQKQEGS